MIKKRKETQNPELSLEAKLNIKFNQRFEDLQIAIDKLEKRVEKLENKNKSVLDTKE